jgi:hypothetical protein
MPKLSTDMATERTAAVKAVLDAMPEDDQDEIDTLTMRARAHVPSRVFGHDTALDVIAAIGCYLVEHPECSEP